MKTFLLVLCLVAVSYAQLPRPTGPLPTGFTRPTGFTLPTGFPTRPRPDGDPRNNQQSQCGFGDRMCPEGARCIERGVPPALMCVNPMPENGACMERMIFDRDTVSDRDRVSDQKRVLIDRGISEERVDRERGDGVRDRDTARTINGIEERPQCASETLCMNNTCRRPDPVGEAICQRQRQSGTQVRCDEEGMFEPLQCRRLPGDTNRDQLPQQLNCRCVNPVNGSMIPNTMRRVTSRDDLPQCASRSFRSCAVRRDGRMLNVRHGNAIPRSRNGQCQRCRCNDGMLQCQNVTQNCPRSDPDRTPASCMMNGEEVQHGERRQAGKCNMCACRNGQLTCTRVMECRAEDADDDRDTNERQCDECMNMPSGPVCAVSVGRTFPTRCHAMRCQGFEMGDLRDRACSERNACEEDMRCGSGSTCMRLGGATRMSRERDSADNRRACVNRMELQCQPTEERSDGSRRIRDDSDPDILERFEDAREMLRRGGDGDGDDNNDGDGDDDDYEDDDDRTVCANDGFEYPSTCHMMLEYSRNDMSPRVMHSGRCRDMPQDDEERRMRMVCATDGMTYADESTMRTVGGNVRMDFRGRCNAFDREGEQTTPAQRCMRAKENNACPELPEDCTRRTTPPGACCPVCGSDVVMALDQDLIDEHVRATGDELTLDDLMGMMLRRNGDKEPVINRTASRMCDMSMTQNTDTRERTVDTLFRAREGRNADFCHQQAMEMMRKLNMEQTSFNTEEDFVAAAIVAPETVVDETEGGAPTFAASCMVLFSAMIVALLF